MKKDNHESSFGENASFDNSSKLPSNFEKSDRDP